MNVNSARVVGCLVFGLASVPLGAVNECIIPVSEGTGYKTSDTLSHRNVPSAEQLKSGLGNQEPVRLKQQVFSLCSHKNMRLVRYLTGSHAGKKILAIGTLVGVTTLMAGLVITAKILQGS